MIPRILSKPLPPGQRPPSRRQPPPPPAIPPPPPPLPPPEEIRQSENKPDNNKKIKLENEPDNNKKIKLPRRSDMMAEMIARHYDTPIEYDQGPSNKKSDEFQPDMPKIVYNFTPQYTTPQKLRTALNMDIDSTYFDNYKKIEKEFYSIHRPQSEVYSTIKIQTILGWEKRVYKEVFEYHEYTIERRDGTIGNFTDSEFPHLNPHDLRFLLVYFGKKLEMGEFCREIFMRVRKALKDYIQDLSWADVELAKCFEVEDVEIDKDPNTEIDNIEKYRNGSVLEEPEFGVICVYENKKQFFRISEVRKLSDVKLQCMIDVVLNHKSLDENLKGYFVDVIFGRINAREWVKECKRMVDYYE